MTFRRLAIDNIYGDYHIPRGFACIDETTGSLRPTAGASRVEAHCATCPRGPFRSASCFFADCSIARARARELDRDRQGKYRAVCQFPGCGAIVCFDSVLCPDHQRQVFRMMAETGETYEGALQDMIDEYEMEEALC
jgi:hypothetical protein